MRVICCGGVCLLVGVLCENCIVDASICMMPLVWWCCVCDVIFSCVFILSSSFFAAVCGLHGFLFVGCVVCVWWLVCLFFRAHGGCLGMLSR